MPFLEGVTNAGSGRHRYVDCYKCDHEHLRVCNKLGEKIRRTVDYCNFFRPKAGWSWSLEDGWRP